MTTAHLLDLDKTLAALGGDATLFRKLAQIFTRTAPQTLGLIEAALAHDDLKRAYAEVRSLIEAVGVFQAPEVFQCVADVATHAKSRDVAAARHAFAAAQPLVRRLVAELASAASKHAAAAAPGGR